jgi:hypothetical protein
MLEINRPAPGLGSPNAKHPAVFRAAAIRQKTSAHSEQSSSGRARFQSEILRNFETRATSQRLDDSNFRQCWGLISVTGICPVISNNEIRNGVQDDVAD